MSAIRTVDIDQYGRVTTLAGGELFEFGLEDAEGTSARFQHPLGVAWHDGTVYVADTYNNAIRAIDVASGRVSTHLGDGEPGTQDGDSPRFDEPNDVMVVGDKLYIADTNNHRIRVAPLSGGSVTTLTFSNPDALRGGGRIADELTAGNVVRVAAQVVAPGRAEIVLDIGLPEGQHLNPDAPSGYVVRNLADGMLRQPDAKGPVTDVPLRISVDLLEGTGSIAVDLTLYYCAETANSLCYFADARVEIPLTVRAGAGSDGTISARYVVGAQM